MAEIGPKKEPVAWGAVIRAGLIIAMAFGLKLDEKQLVGIALGAEAITSIVTRQSVTPNSKLE